MSKLPAEFVKPLAKQPKPKAQRTRKASLISPDPVRDPHELVLHLTEEEYSALEHARRQLHHGDAEVSLEQMIHRVFADWMLRTSARPETPPAEPELLARLRTLIASPRRLLHELAGRMRRTLA